jgi:hypothetical protein
MAARYGLAIMAALWMGRPLCCIAAPTEADLILHHGNIVTVDRAFSILRDPGHGHSHVRGERHQ